MKFLLPDKIPQFDFQFELLRANEFFKWRTGKPFEIAYGDADVTYCPVGSVEFCRSHGITCAPRNIPFELSKWAYGFATYSKKSELSDGVRYYVKSSLTIKDERNGIYLKDDIPFEDNLFQATEYLDEGFISEWRCFVQDGKLLDIKQYVAADESALFVMPIRGVVDACIQEFKHAPCAYTLDVGVTSYGTTHVIEVHDFFACGLYKFDDQYRLPSMLWNWYQDYRKTKTQ